MGLLDVMRVTAAVDPEVGAFLAAAEQAATTAPGTPPRDSRSGARSNPAGAPNAPPTSCTR